MRSARSCEIFVIFGKSPFLVGIAQRRACGGAGRGLLITTGRRGRYARRARCPLCSCPSLREDLSHTAECAEHTGGFGGKEDRRALSLRNVRQRLEVLVAKQVHRCLTVGE